jgi:hypothetical protein
MGTPSKGPRLRRRLPAHLTRPALAGSGETGRAGRARSGPANDRAEVPR